MVKLIFKLLLLTGFVLLLKSFLPASITTQPAPNRTVATKQPSIQNHSTSCQSANLSLSWPLKGKPNQDWVVNNYEDLDPGPGIKDFSGAVGKFARVYNGHKGIDIDVPTFRWTDENFPVIAAADGIVTRSDFSHPDRNLVTNVYSKNPPPWNFVEIQHANGSYSIYGHLKQHTGYVKVGDKIRRGQKLGVVASSGNSSWPHLHFEVRDCNRQVVHTTVEKLWQNLPPYNTTFDLMEVVIRADQPPQDAVRFIIDGKPNQLKHISGKNVTVATILAGGEPGDKVEVIVKASGRVYREFKKTMDQNYRKSFWYWYFTLPDNYSGGVRVDVKLNDDTRRTEYLQLSKS